MKITKKKLINIIKEEIDSITADPLSESVLRAISGTVFDTLEAPSSGMPGASAEEAQNMLENLDASMLMGAIEVGVEDYLKKLRITGGPKPPQSDEPIGAGTTHLDQGKGPKRLGPDITQRLSYPEY